MAWGRHQNRLDVGVEIKIDLVSVMGSIKTCFFLRDGNRLGFRLGIRLDLLLCGGQNRLRCCVQAENYLVLIYGSKLTCFLCEGRT